MHFTQRAHSPVRLLPVGSEWGERFVAEQTRLRGVLGTRAGEIEHMGSTAVPGLLARHSPR